MFEKIQQAYELLLPIVEAGGVLTGSSDGADDDDDDDGDDDDENIEVDENGNKKSKLDDGSALGLVGGMSGLRNIGLLMNHPTALTTTTTTTATTTTKTLKSTRTETRSQNSTTEAPWAWSAE